jgi:hypothetical protein
MELKWSRVQKKRAEKTPLYMGLAGMEDKSFHCVLGEPAH